MSSGLAGAKIMGWGEGPKALPEVVNGIATRSVNPQVVFLDDSIAVSSLSSAPGLNRGVDPARSARFWASSNGEARPVAFVANAMGLWHDGHKATTRAP
jgi:hypothetical protein